MNAGRKMIKMWLHSVYPTVTGYNVQVSFFSPFFRLPPQICQLAVIVHIASVPAGPGTGTSAGAATSRESV